jgi:DNA-binding transcriptional LysR family regulator
MDRLREMAVFIAAADTGGFAKAGARMRVSPPAVTRIIATLEDRLGVRLFTRSTRRITLTEAGRRFLEASRRVLADVESAEKDAAGEAALPQGHLRITASATFGREVLTPIVTHFLHAHARVTASLMLLDRVVNLVEEGVDVGIRIGDLPDSSLLARQIGEVRRVLVASPAYLASRGIPKAPADLKGHAVIAFTSLMPGRECGFAIRARAQPKAGITSCSRLGSRSMMRPPPSPPPRRAKASRRRCRTWWRGNYAPGP